MKQLDLARKNKVLFGSDILLRGIFSFGAITPRAESALFREMDCFGCASPRIDRA